MDSNLVKSYHGCRGLCFRHCELEVYKEYFASRPATILAYSDHPPNPSDTYCPFPLPTLCSLLKVLNISLCLISKAIIGLIQP